MPAALRRVGQHWEESHRTLLALEWVITSAVPYGATDGLQLLINPAGIADWSLGEVAFLLVHEARHVDLLHPVRFKGWVHAIANQAGDYVINGEIHRVNRAVFASHKFTPFPLPEGILLDPVLSAGDLSASDVYRILLAAGNTPPPPSNPAPTEEEASPAMASPAKVSPAKVSPAKVSPAKVSPAKVSPAKVSPALPATEDPALPVLPTSRPQPRRRGRR
jgi:hypothetical protein